jgi:hypothetical protein
MNIKDYRALEKSLAYWDRCDTSYIPKDSTVRHLVSAARRDLARWQECDICHGDPRTVSKHNTRTHSEFPCPACDGRGVVPSERLDAETIRAYFRNNMFDGDEGGVYTAKVHHLLDKMVEVVGFIFEDKEPTDDR